MKTLNVLETTFPNSYNNNNSLPFFILLGCKVLNYAPGPVHTNMIDEVINDANVNQGLKESFCTMIQNRTILKPEQSAQKLVQILEENCFRSGDHIDYYD